MMKLVYDDVVEPIRWKVPKVFGSAKRLNRREQNVGGGVFFVSSIPTEPSPWTNSPESRDSLIENFLSVSDKEDTDKAFDRAPRRGVAGAESAQRSSA
jgi:hypothetical protein